MSNHRKRRVTMAEQIKLINQCRRSGLTDADWCRANQIAPSTFYRWVSRCRKAASEQIVEPSYGHSSDAKPVQEVVPVSIIPDHPAEIPEYTTAFRSDTHLDNSHTIEISVSEFTIRVNNSADPVLLARTLQLLKELAC